MRLRYWIAEAKSGAVVAEVRVAGAVQLDSQFGGGSASLSLSLSHLTTSDGRRMDAAAVKRTIALVDGGRRTLVVTDDRQRALGEWLLLSRGLSSSDGTMPVRGIEWVGYPALRSLNDHFVYSGTDQLTIARHLLEGAFLSYNTGMQISVPAASSGVLRSMDRRARSCYFSDALDEIASPDDGFEWHVEVTPTWSGSQLVSVSRAVVFGAPILSRSSDVEFYQAAPGSRRGNADRIAGGDDFSRYAQSVYGIGAGSGEKQVIVGLSDPTLTNAGYLNSTKNVSFPDVTDVAVLTARTRGELVAAQDLRDPFQAVGQVDRLRALPAVGLRVRLRSDPTWGFPDGLDEQVRVGRVSWTIDGHFCSRVTVDAI